MKKNLEKSILNNVERPMFILAHPDDEALFWGGLNCLC